MSSSTKPKYETPTITVLDGAGATSRALKIGAGLGRAYVGMMHGIWTQPTVCNATGTTRHSAEQGAAIARAIGRA